jgi:RNA polymerase sigma-70 factor (ECF subfamily)
LAAPSGKDPSDDALVSAARDGNVRAFEALLLRHESRVLRVLRLMGVHTQDREDVAQEVFLRVFRHLDGYKPGRDFGGWLYRVSVNAAYDYRLRKGKAARDEAPWTDDVASSSGAAVPAEAEGTALRARLEAALDTLSDRERAVFVLKELEGLETSEVAKTLGITTVTVRRHLALAKARLQRELAGSG